MCITAQLNVIGQWELFRYVLSYFLNFFEIINKSKFWHKLKPNHFKILLKNKPVVRLHCLKTIFRKRRFSVDRSPCFFKNQFYLRIINNESTIYDQFYRHRKLGNPLIKSTDFLSSIAIDLINFHDSLTFHIRSYRPF